MRKLLTLFSLLFFINFVSATIVCNPTYIMTSFNESDSITKSIHCINNANESVSISKTGNYFSITDSIIGASPSEKTIQINFNNNINPGSYQESITFGDNSAPVPIVFNVLENIPVLTSTCNIDVFPSILNNVKIKQGETKTRQIQLSIPNCYQTSVNLNGVVLQTDEQPIQLGELAIGIIQPGNSIMIPIELNANDVSTGQYQDTLQLLIYDNKGNKINIPSVSVSVLVSTGIQAISNFSFGNLPICSLNALEMNLNNTYQLTCSINNPNIQVKPVIDTQYLKGVSVEETSTQYIYRFQPIKMGESKMKAEFLYKNSLIGSPYEQDIRISSSGASPVAGTVLKIAFYQEGIQMASDKLNYGLTSINVLDNKTNSLISDYKLMLGGVQLVNNTIDIQPSRTYELRTIVPGYLDSVLTFEANPQSIKIIVSPEKGTYAIGEELEITTEPVNATILFNDVIMTPPFRLEQSGNVSIKAVMENYNTKEIFVTVNAQISITSCSILFEDWDKGSHLFCDLTEEVKWQIYKDSFLVKEGTSKRIEFEINDYGNWIIKTEEYIIFQKEVKQTSVWYNPLTWKWVASLGYWWVLIGIFAVIMFIILRKNNSNTPTPYS